MTLIRPRWNAEMPHIYLEAVHSQPTPRLGIAMLQIRDDGMVDILLLLP